MALPAAAQTFLTHFEKPLKRFKVQVAYSAVHHPLTFDATDGDDGHGHEVDDSTVAVPRLGPDRMCLKGEAVRFYAGDSYGRGGAGVAIEGWTAYYLGTDTPHDNVFAGTEVAGEIVSPSPDGGGNPATATFTPTQAGHYRIEMHAAGMLLNGDGVAAPYPNACRYVRVFDTDEDGNQIEFDGEGIATLAANGSLESGGWSGTISIKRGRGITAPYPEDNQRVIFHVKTFFAADRNGPWAEYTWNPGHGTTDYIWYSPNIFFEALVRGGSVQENHLTGEVSFQVVGMYAALNQLSFPLTPREISLKGLGPPDVPGTGFSDYAATSFMDKAAFDLLISKVKANIRSFLWVHRIADMKYSDPIIHLLTRHTNYATFFDVNIWQNDTDSLMYTDLSEGSLFGWIKKLETERFGVVFCDAKGVLNIGPEPDLRGPDYWASIADPDIIFDGRHYRDIHLQTSPPSVSQVILVSIDQAEILPAAFRGDTGDDIIKLIQRKQHTATWPSNRTTGVRFEKFGVPIYGRSELATVARRLHKRLNKTYPSIQMTFQMLTGIDLLQNVGVTFSPRRGLPEGGWTNKLTHVTGVQMQINFNRLQWTTTLTVAETVDAAAVQVPDAPPVAAFDSTAFREVMADGTEKRFLLLRTRAVEGDAAIVQSLWRSDGGGGAKTGARVVYAYDGTVDTVTLAHNVIDDAGLSSTVEKVIDLSALPDIPATFGETVWVASEAGSHVSPDGGATWLESGVVGEATAVWASDNSQWGFFGNAIGEVHLTQDLGITFLTVDPGILPASPVRAIWGDEKYPSAIVGYENGQLWEVAWRTRRASLIAAEIRDFRTQTGNAAPATFVYVSEGVIFVGAGDSLYAGTRSDWRKIARFPGTILRGAARSQPAIDVYAEDGGYTFIISLVFAVGAENFQEQGRVQVGRNGIEWLGEAITPVPNDAGADTTVGAIDQGAAILSSFADVDLPFLLPSVVSDSPGPARVASTAVPAMSSIKAIEYGLDGRDHAFAGHSTGVHKNFDPNAVALIGVAPSNVWLPFHETGAQVRDLFVTRPQEPPTLYRGMIYVLMPASAARTDLVVWSPKSDPPSFEHTESYFKDETVEDVLPRPNQGGDYAHIIRWRSAADRRLPDKTIAAMLPGFKSLSQFVLINTDAGSSTSRGLYHPRIPEGYTGTRFIISDEGTNGGITTGGTISGVGGTNRLVGERVVGAAVQGNGRGGGAAGIQQVYTFAHYPTGYSATIPLLGGDARFYNHYYARRDHDPQPGIRGSALHNDPSGPGYSAHHFWWAIDDSGLVLPGYDGGVLFSGGSTISTPLFMSNEYVLLDDPYTAGLYHFPLGDAPTYYRDIGDAAAVSGPAVPFEFLCESFDTYWLLNRAGFSDWELLYRDPADPTTFVPFPWPAELTDYLDAWDAGWSLLYPLTAAGLTDEAVILVANAAETAFRLISVRTDASWDDVSGNLWESAPGAGDGLYSAGTRPIALRHVLPSEFNPTQYADAPTMPIAIPDWELPAEAPDTTAPYPVAVLADTPFVYYRMSDHPYYGKAYDATGGGRHIAYASRPDQPWAFDADFRVPGLVAGDTATRFRTVSMDLGQHLTGYAGDWTIEAIVKRAADETAGDHYLLGHDDGAILSLIWNGTDFYFYNGGSATIATMATDTVYHVAVSYEAATGVMKGYVDGVETYSDTIGSGQSLGTGTTKLLSIYGDTADGSFEGVVDEIAFYKAVLAPSRVAAHAALV